MSDEGGSGSNGGGGKGGFSGGKGDGGGSSPGGGGSPTGTDLAGGPSGPPNQNTVGASTRSSLLPIFGGNFSADGGGGMFDSQPTSNNAFSAGNPSTGSIANSEGVTAINSAAPTALGLGASAPPGGGGLPSDLTSKPTGGDAMALSPEQLGQPAAGGAKPGGEKSVLESLGVKNPLGAAIGAAGLGYSVLQGQQSPKFSPEMEAAARKLDANGQQLMSYLQSGNLPPGLKASLDQATASAKAKIVSNFAAQGMNTDPTQNTALAAQLAQVDQQAIISTAQMGQQLMASGLAESGLSSDLYKTLANIDQTQTANIGKAIASFASAVSGSGGGLQLKLG